MEHVLHHLNDDHHQRVNSDAIITSLCLEVLHHNCAHMMSILVFGLWIVVEYSCNHKHYDIAQAAGLQQLQLVLIFLCPWT